MTIDEALEKLQEKWGLFDTEHEPNDTREICSGGERADPVDPPPGLYISKALAVESFYRCVDDFLAQQKPTCWRIVGDVSIDKWRITVTDSMNTHRVANDRYSVSARIGVTWLTAKTPPAAVQETAAHG